MGFVRFFTGIHPACKKKENNKCVQVVNQSSSLHATSVGDLLRAGITINELNVYGGVVVQNNDNSRKMEGVSFDGATLNGITNFQSDNNIQTYQTGLDSHTEDLFAELIKEINRISDPDDRQDNLEDARKIKEAIASDNKERAAKFFGRLGKAIQISSAGVSLAKNLGLLDLLK